MDDFDLPDDLKDDVEVVYLDGDDLEDELNHEYEMEDSFGAGMLEENEIEAEVIDVSKATFGDHKSSVFMCDLSKCGSYAVTGSEDEMAYVWSTSTQEIIMECTGHKDSVTEVCFSFDDKYIATADMSGLVQIWSFETKKLLWCYEAGEDVEWLMWHPSTSVLIAGFQSGDIYAWQFLNERCKVLPSHGYSTMCGKIMPDGKHIIAGYGDGQLKLWDIKLEEALWQLKDVKANDGITSLDVSADGTLVAVAPTGQLFKTLDGKLISQLLPDNETDVEAISFNSDLGIIVTGSISGRLCVWDIAKNSLRHQAKIEACVTLFEWGPNDKLCVGANDGAVYVCDVKSGTLIETLTGHKSDIFSMSICRSKNLLLTTSDDGTAKIFNI